MAAMLKFWHQYGYIITIVGYIFLVGMNYGTYKSAMAALQDSQIAMQTTHDKENADHRLTILEQIAADNRDNFSEIKDTEKAIFARINQLTDGKR